VGTEELINKTRLLEFYSRGSVHRKSILREQPMRCSFKLSFLFKLEIIFLKYGTKRQIII
jgi:hypothetical protein